MYSNPFFYIPGHLEAVIALAVVAGVLLIANLIFFLLGKNKNDKKVVLTQGMIEVAQAQVNANQDTFEQETVKPIISLTAPNLDKLETKKKTSTTKSSKVISKSAKTTKAVSNSAKSITKTTTDIKHTKTSVKATNNSNVEKVLPVTKKEEQKIETKQSKVKLQTKAKEIEKISATEVNKLMTDKEVQKRTTKGQRIADRTNRTMINIYVISKFFNDGETVTLEEIKKRIPNFDKKTTFYKVCARGTLDKKLTIDADDLSIEAKKMILLTGGKVIVSISK